MHHDSTCAHARVRTSSTPDNLDAASSADVSSYLVLKAMTLSPIRAIIHLSWLSSPLALSSSLFSLSLAHSCPLGSILHVFTKKETEKEREERETEKGVDVTYSKRASRAWLSSLCITNH